MNLQNIEEIVNSFIYQITPEHRYASFDYCFNYYKSHDLTIDKEKIGASGVMGRSHSQI
jgi:hypothetical protein